MPDNGNDQIPDVKSGHGAWDAVIAGLQTVRDILNDWRVMVTLLIVILLWAGRVAAPELGAMVEGWIRAWKCLP
jgi:hypothetical protein